MQTFLAIPTTDYVNDPTPRVQSVDLFGTTGVSNNDNSSNDPLISDEFYNDLNSFTQTIDTNTTNINNASYESPDIFDDNVNPNLDMDVAKDNVPGNFNDTDDASIDKLPQIVPTVPVH